MTAAEAAEAAEVTEATEAAENSGEVEPGAEQKSRHNQTLLIRPADLSEVKGVLDI